MNDTAKPLITTIIPTYRRPKLLRRAIKSVFNQTYPHFVICVYDNASGDETAEVVAELAKEDTRVKYHCHKQNIGAVKNFCFGIKLVQTPFFNILSDDDWILPDFYELSITALQSYPNTKFFAGTTINVDDSLSPLFASPDESFPEGINSVPEGMFRMINGHIPWTSIIFSTSLIEESGILDSPSATLDYDFEVLAAKKHSFIVSRRPCAIYLCHALNAAKTISAEAMHLGVLHLTGKLLKDNNLPYSTQRQIWQVMNHQQFRFVCTKVHHNFMLQQIPDAMRAVAILLEIRKFSLKTMLFESFCLAVRLFPISSKFISVVLLIRYRYLEKKEKERTKRKYGRFLCNLRPYFNSISEE